METKNVNDVKKELYKSKAMAKLSHYTSGNLYYTVELEDGTYQFPISTIEKNTLISIETLAKSRIIELEKNDEPRAIEVVNEINTLNYELEKIATLSSDLGTTSFENEMMGHSLNRWISKAIDKGEFIQIG